MTRKSTPASEPVGVGAGRRLLVIEDSDLTLRMEVAFLSGAGFEVRGAHHIAEFRELTADWQPDIILADVNLPGMSGAELCSQLKSRFETRGIPVILFSNMADEELERLKVACGADGFLSKRRGLVVLLQEIDRLCDQIVF